jgi:uncharacterized phosphosugar-binding protein
MAEHSLFFAGTWTNRAQQLLTDLTNQQGANISTAAQWCAESILKDGVVHLWAAGLFPNSN